MSLPTFFSLVSCVGFGMFGLDFLEGWALILIDDLFGVGEDLVWLGLLCC